MANYLYNGVELPDIHTVWTDKETYPYACVLYVADGSAEIGFPAQFASLQLFEVRGVAENDSLSVEGTFKYRNYIWTDSQELVDLYASVGITCAVNTWFLIEDYPALNASLFALPSWSSYDILNTDGSVYLAASAPVPAAEEM